MVQASGKKRKPRATPKRGDGKNAGTTDDPTKTRAIRETAWTIHMGDTIKVERRYVVDGHLTSVEDKGRFGGVQLLGGAEHIVIEDKDDVRMIPLHTVSEIVLDRRDDVMPSSEFDPSYL